MIDWWRNLTGRRNGHGSAVEASPPRDKMDAVLGTLVDMREERAMQESIPELESYEDGWVRMAQQGSVEFSESYLQVLTRLSRVMYLKNPLINRAVEVQKFYVWGLGWSVKANNQVVNDAIQEFLDDDDNKAELTGAQAREGKEVEQQVTGNNYLVLFVNKNTGLIKVSSFPREECTGIVTDPDNARRPWYYLRTYEASVPGEKIARVETRKVAYRDWRYQPGGDSIPAIVNGHVVQTEEMTDISVMHWKSGGFNSSKFGMPENYSAFSWALAAKSHLEDWATVWKSLSQFAWKYTDQRKGAIEAAKERLSTTLGTGVPESNPPAQTASVFLSTANAAMEPMKTAGVRPSPEEGEMLWLMVASACGLPLTFFGNVDIGNLATAKTLDRPTELRMRLRQKLIADWYMDLFNLVIFWNAKADNGLLKGIAKIGKDRHGKEIVLFEQDPKTEEPINGHVDIQFADLLERDVTERVNAVTTAVTLGGRQDQNVLPKKRYVALLLDALGVDDVDEEIQALEDDGWFDEPEVPEPEEVNPDGEIDPDTGLPPQDVPPGEALRQVLGGVVEVLERVALRDGAYQNVNDLAEIRGNVEALSTKVDQWMAANEREAKEGVTNERQ